MGLEQRRPRRVRFVLAAVAGSVVLAFAIAEVALRVAGYERSYANALNAFHVNDPDLGYRGRPNLERRFERPQFNVLVQHDDKGFRRVVPPADPSKVQHQVFVLGDSVVWGWGVDQGKVVTDQLQRMLPDTRVFNLGLNGAGTVMELVLCGGEVWHRVVEGDTVVVVFVWNDFFDNVNPTRLHARPTDAGIAVVRPTEQVLSGTDSVLDRILVLNSLHTAWSLWKIRRARPSEPEQAAHLKQTDDAAVVTREALALMRTLTKVEKGRFLVAYFPGRYETPGEGFESERGFEQDRAFRAAFEGVAKDAQVETLDLLPAFLEAKKKTPGLRLLIPDDGHPNEAGHEVMARAIAEVLLHREAGH